MLTLGLYVVLAVAVTAAVFFVVASILPAGERIAPAVRDEEPWTLPAEHPLGAEDVASLRLPVALRGYRFAETDELLDRLGEELRSRDALIAQLRGGGAGEPADVPVSDAPPADAPAVDAPAVDEPAEAPWARPRPGPGPGAEPPAGPADDG